jgi:hypothetical protein
LRIEEIVLVVLLDDVELRGIDERAEMNCGGVDRGRDVFEVQRERAGGEMNLADVADQGDIRVVDRDGEIDLVSFGGHRGLLARGVIFFRLRGRHVQRASGERKGGQSCGDECGADDCG